MDDEPTSLGAVLGERLRALAEEGDVEVVRLPGAVVDGERCAAQRRTARREQREILRELPDLGVGLLKAFVTAGLGLEQGRR